MDTTLKFPLHQRINFRIIAFFSVMLVLIGWPVYIYIDSAVHGGIKRTADGVEVDLKAMSVFPFDQVNGNTDDVPKKWRDLDGQKIITTGEMWQPESAAQYVTKFDLVYSIGKCCFNGPPQVQHFVRATAAPNATIEYFTGLVRVRGTLHVNVTREQEKVASVYSIDVESVKAVN